MKRRAASLRQTRGLSATAELFIFEFILVLHDLRN